MSDKRKSAAASLHPDGHGHAHGNFGYHDHDEDTPMGHSHSHGGAPPHEHPNSPGRYPHREEEKSRRDYIDRAFTVGIGGPVGSGKTALVLSLCRAMREKYGLVVVTNDIFTKEDCEFLVKHDALPNGRIKAVETGGCPHAAIREDCSANLTAAMQLSVRFAPDLCLIESGGDNLAANFSRELADYIIYVIDVAGGDKVPRKGGPGITQSDLLIINKTDLAELVGADLVLMSQQAHDMREGGPVVLAQVKHMVGIPAIIDHIIAAWTRCTGKAPKHVMSTAPTTATTTTSTCTISSEAPAPAPPSMDMNDDMDSRKKTRVA